MSASGLTRANGMKESAANLLLLIKPQAQKHPFPQGGWPEGHLCSDPTSATSAHLGGPP